MERLKVCVIGLGTMGSQHLNVFATMPQARVLAVADLNRELALREAGQYAGEIEIYTDYKKMLAEQRPDAVVIALPDAAHREPVLAALAAGAHVLVEKPLAVTVADSDAMIREAKDRGRVLMVNFSHRWASAYYRAHELIAGGELGRPVMAYTKKDDTIGVVERWPWLSASSPAAFLSSHDIDLTLWYMDSEVKTVYARGVKRVLASRGVDTWDCMQALVEFESGAIATFESGWIYPNTFPTLTDSYLQITCERGVVQLPRLREQLEVASEKEYSFPRLGISPKIDGRVQGAFRLSLEHFVDCVREGRQPLTSGLSSRRVTQIIDAIHQSAESGEIVRLR